MIRFRVTALVSFMVALVACDAPDTPADPYAIGREIVARCVAEQCTRLDLDAVDLEDYSVLNDMPHVTTLMMSYSGFSDLTAIAGMTQLTELHIGYSEVADLTGLAAFPNLTLLHAQNLRNVTDHSPVTGLTGVTELAIGDYGFDQVAVVRAMPQVRRLLLVLDTEADLSPLRAHPGLEVVDFGTSIILDLSVMTTLPRLREVGVAGFIDGSNVAEVAATLTARGVTVDQRDVMPVC